MTMMVKENAENVLWKIQRCYITVCEQIGMFNYYSNLVIIGVQVHDKLYHLELWPNRDFLHPGMVIEKRNPEIEIKHRYVRTLKGKKLCHYTGRVRGYPQSKAAISTCDGLVSLGFIQKLS